jgi:diacylglycerol kinase family enzyme
VGTHVQYLARKGHAEELCRTLDFSEYDVLCIIGGDGTFHECVNGIMKRSDDKGKMIPLAVLPGGTGE